MDHCYLCGHLGAGTTEHIVPRCLYPGKLPSDVLTLPAHRQCNKFTSTHEEVFRNHIALGIPPDNPGFPLWETTWRAIHRPQAAGMQREFYQNMLSRFERGPDGVRQAVPEAAGLKNERGDWVLAKIVKGLFTIETGELLPSAKVRWRFGQVERGRAQISLPMNFSVHNVLTVSWGRAVDEPLSTVWVIGFHETAWFWISTRPTTRLLSNRAAKAKAMIWPGPGEV